MINWMTANIGTIIITLVLIGIVAAVILVMRRDKKEGKSACGGNCGHCSMGCSWHRGK